MVFILHIWIGRWIMEKKWGNLAILEVETDINKIVLPKNSFGKVRTSEITVLREVPLEECGLYGKILAKKRGEKRWDVGIKMGCKNITREEYKIWKY